MISFDKNRVVEIVKRNVSSLPIYRDGQRVDARLLCQGVMWACYAPIPHIDHSFRTSFHLNFEENICYLAEINLAKALRGKGIGEAMYKSVEGIAKEMGCRRIVQTASGQTNTGERRGDYLKRKLGYVEISPGAELMEVEKILT